MNIKKQLLLPLLTAVCACAPALADDLPSGGNHSDKLALIIPNLFGTGGLTLPNPTHNAHFDSAFQSNFMPFNAALAGQLTSLPIPSPASGFTYTFDKTLGVYSRSAQSFGPILAERAETIGKDKFYFGISYQRFKFDSIDGIDLHQVPALFQHAVVENPDFRKDIITTDNFLDIQIGQLTTFFTYGLNDRLDVSVAVPFVSASLKATSNATIRRIGTANEDCTVTSTTCSHYFDTTIGDRSTKQFSGSGSAQGIGDVIVRLKGTVFRSERTGLALGLDMRAPTGDQFDFLGSGALGFKPFAAFSGRAGRISPHVNAAFQWNGSTVLAGDVMTGRKQHLPNQFLYVGGADIGVTKQFTLALDVLGQSVHNGERVIRDTYTAANGTMFPEISFKRGTLNEVNGSAGFKINAIGKLLVEFNLLFKLNDSGLRSKVTPLIGLSYTL
jgi:hypothetical protein